MEQFVETEINDNLELIKASVEESPDWNKRVCRTYSGLRIMVMHDVFAPNNSKVDEFFEAVNCDLQYVSVCPLQNCFTATISSKLGRINLEPNHVRLHRDI